MDLRAIKTKRQYRRYLAEARSLVRLDPHPRTPEGARLERLALLIEDYEKKRFFVVGENRPKRRSTRTRASS